MNKYQETLNNLVKVSCPEKTCCKECDFEKHCNCDAKRDINTLQELVDKETLKEPKHYSEEKDGHWNGDIHFAGSTIEYWVCPKCESFIGYLNDCEDQINYCPNCGQALDWGEENE
ncbi:hypothetical protein DWX45_16405 [Erysipelotrichaceae bacterium AF19-24AC]|nr:hypothetical protein DWX45_16405 [Erysipelotrichaceae bacterium AF19-24AC]